MTRIRIDIPSSFSFSTELTVRVGDVNYGGHLGNDALLSLLQEARVLFLRGHGYTEMNIEGAGIIMIDAGIQYKAEAFPGDGLRIEVGIVEWTESGCDFVYRVTHATTGKEIARAKTGIVFFDYERRRVVGVPQAFRTVVQHL